MRALVVGDVMVVTAGRVSRLPATGENLLLAGAAVYTSGVGANIALSLAALGVEVTLASAVGLDALGDAVLRDLRAGGVGVDHVARAKASSTGSMVVMVDPSGERTMVGTRGAAERFPLEPSLLEVAATEWMHASGYTLLDDLMAGRCAALLGVAAARGTPCSVDLEGVAGSAHRIPLGGVTVFCGPGDLTVREDLVRGSNGAPIVVKDGPRGCTLIQGGETVAVPTSPVEAVDATGAGDAFDAAFIAARLRGLDAVEACRWGNAAGGMAARVPGPRAALSVERLRAAVAR